jgi:hypothetical protein
MKYLNDREQRYNRFALVEALVHAGVIPETLSAALVSAGLQHKHHADRLEDFLREHHQELPATWLRLSLVDMVESIHRSFDSIIAQMCTYSSFWIRLKNTTAKLPRDCPAFCSGGMIKDGSNQQKSLH